MGVLKGALSFKTILESIKATFYTKDCLFKTLGLAGQYTVDTVYVATFCSKDINYATGCEKLELQSR